MLEKPELSIVVPCYNEARNIPLILRRFAEAIKDGKTELVLVDNGSWDGTQRILGNELKKHPFARSVRVKKNIGYGYGVMFGLRNCRGRFLAYTHADMQCDPADVANAYTELLRSKEPEKTLVKGTRIGRNSIVSKALVTLVSALFLRKYSDINAQPKVFHSSLMKMLEKPPHGFTLDLYLQHIALKNGWWVREVPVKFGERRHGKSSWSSSMFSRIKTIINFILYIFILRARGY